jgi:hypothetical protein
VLRIEVIDLASGKTVHEFAYGLTDGSGVSEITALNNHEFLVDERDGDGRGNGDAAVVKKIFKIDLDGAIDVSNMDGTHAAANVVKKTLFLDVVKALVNAGFDPANIPAKLEGIALARTFIRVLSECIRSGWPMTMTSWPRSPILTTYKSQTRISSSSLALRMNH